MSRVPNTRVLETRAPIPNSQTASLTHACIESGGIVSDGRRLHGLVFCNTGAATACIYLRPHRGRFSSGAASGSTIVIT